MQGKTYPNTSIQIPSKSSMELETECRECPVCEAASHEIIIAWMAGREPQTDMSACEYCPSMRQFAQTH
jgi:MinD superfamily P-loop ATPase